MQPLARRVGVKSTTKKSSRLPLLFTLKLKLRLKLKLKPRLKLKLKLCTGCWLLAFLEIPTFLVLACLFLSS